MEGKWGRGEGGGVCYIWGSGSTGGPIGLRAAGKMSYNIIIITINHGGYQMPPNYF